MSGGDLPTGRDVGQAGAAAPRRAVGEDDRDTHAGDAGLRLEPRQPGVERGAQVGRGRDRCRRRARGGGRLGDRRRARDGRARRLCRFGRRGSRRSSAMRLGARLAAALATGSAGGAGSHDWPSQPPIAMAATTAARMRRRTWRFMRARNGGSCTAHHTAARRPVPSTDDPWCGRRLAAPRGRPPRRRSGRLGPPRAGPGSGRVRRRAPRPARQRAARAGPDRQVDRARPGAPPRRGAADVEGRSPRASDRSGCRRRRSSTSARRR